MTRALRITELPVTESTNDDVRRAAEAGEAEGLVVWALQQTKGRGRQGRAWKSPVGNLYASVLLRPRAEAKHAGHYAFVTALAVHDTIKACLPDTDTRIKWPNDLLIGGKKTGGILTESAQKPDGMIDWLIAGIGLNVAGHPPDTPYPATSLHAEGGRNLELPQILTVLLNHLFRWRDTLEMKGFPVLRSAWLDAAYKGRLSVNLADGKIEGDFAGLNDDGSLVLQLADGGKKAISAGDVFLV